MQTWKVLLLASNEERELADDLEQILRSDPSRAVEVWRTMARGPDCADIFRELASTRSASSLDAAFFLFHPGDGLCMAAALEAFHRTLGCVPVLEVVPPPPSAAEPKALPPGFTDYLIAPLHPQAVRLRLARWVEGRRLRACPRPSETMRLGFGQFIGASPLLLVQLSRIEAAASCDAHVLIMAETGTGKELCARAVHARSARAAHQFVPYNCSSLSPDLADKTLFGHVRGAFTGANEPASGLVEEANKGTLFLDEIGCAPLLIQPKLLRLIENGEYYPVGSAKPRRADVRIVAATNRDLEQAVRTGQFREDLFYRLNVIRLTMPPLRHRKEDIPALARHFLEKHGNSSRKGFKTLTPEALHKLVQHDWPGNVRELENVVGHALIFSETASIGQEDVLNGQAEPACFPSLKVFLQAQRKDYITRVLAACGGDQLKTAEKAGIDRVTLWRMMRQFGQG